MKFLILATWLAVTQTSAPIPRQTGNGSTRNSQQSDKQTNDKQKPTDTSSLIPSKKQAPAANTASKEHGDTNTDQSVRITELPPVSVKDGGFNWQGWSANFLLLVVSLLQIYILFKTLKATDIAATAAKTSADAVIQSERAWVLFDDSVPIQTYWQPIEVQHGKKTAAAFNFKNFGKTVARITAWKFGLYITNIDEDPPASACDIGATVFHPSIVPQGDQIPHLAELQITTGIITKADLDSILLHRTKNLWLCGLIRYEDIFRKDPAHETFVCRCWGTWVPGADPYFKLAGPTEYNRTT